MCGLCAGFGGAGVVRAPGRRGGRAPGRRRPARDVQPHVRPRLRLLAGLRLLRDHVPLRLAGRHRDRSRPEPRRLQQGDRLAFGLADDVRHRLRGLALRDAQRHRRSPGELRAGRRFLRRDHALRLRREDAADDRLEAVVAQALHRRRGGDPEHVRELHARDCGPGRASSASSRARRSPSSRGAWRAPSSRASSSSCRRCWSGRPRRRCPRSRARAAATARATDRGRAPARAAARAEA